MNITEKQLLELVTAFAKGSMPKIYEDVSGAELYELAKAHGVTGIVSHMLQKAKAERLLSEDKRLESAFDKTITQLIRKEYEAEALLSRLRDAQIPHIIFKGLVVKDCYPIKELRTYGDIDIIIKEQDREKSHQLMLSGGYDWKFEDGGEVYAYKKGKEHYEFHTTLNFDTARRSQYMRDFWSFAVKRQEFTYEFEPVFHFCYLISHIEKHLYSSGAGIRMYLDIALFLEKYKDFDMNSARKILKEAGKERFLDTVLMVCSHWFGTSFLPENPLDEDVFERFGRCILEKGAFGDRSLSAGLESEVRKSRGGKLGVVFKHIFPPYREVRRLYPFFNGKPYLLPVGWCVHFVKAGKRSGFGNLKKIASADTAKAKEEQEFLKAVGLER